MDYHLVKACPNCKSTCSKTNFPKDTEMNDHLYTQYKNCVSDYYIKKRERIAHQQKQYYSENRFKKRIIIKLII